MTARLMNSETCVTGMFSLNHLLKEIQDLENHKKQDIHDLSPSALNDGEMYLFPKIPFFSSNVCYSE